MGVHKSLRIDWLAQSLYMLSRGKLATRLIPPERETVD